MKQSLRYLNNAKEILKTVPLEDSTYTDVKPVREAMGTAYLAVLEAINEHLAQKGLTKKELPKSVEGYRRATGELAIKFPADRYRGDFPASLCYPFSVESFPHALRFLFLERPPWPFSVIISKS